MSDALSHDGGVQGGVKHLKLGDGAPWWVRPQPIKSRLRGGHHVCVGRMTITVTQQANKKIARRDFIKTNGQRLLPLRLILGNAPSQIDFANLRACGSEKNRGDRFYKSSSAPHKPRR